jgi:hypothetical protein
MVHKWCYQQQEAPTIKWHVLLKKITYFKDSRVLTSCFKGIISIVLNMNQPKTTKIGLSERQLKALPFLISAGSEGEACRQAKIAKHTYYEWLKNPLFKNELRRLRDLVVEDAVEALKAGANKAVDTLVRLLDDPNPLLQRNVANDILGHVAKFKELHELEKRLEVLERSNKTLIGGIP